MDHSSIHPGHCASLAGVSQGLSTLHWHDAWLEQLDADLGIAENDFYRADLFDEEIDLGVSLSDSESSQ